MKEELKGRVLLNGDCGCYFYNPELWQPEGGRYSKKAIHRMIRHLADLGVDTFLINPNGQLPCYPSKRLRYQYMDYVRDDRDYARVHWRDCEGVQGKALEDCLDRQTFTNNLYLDLIEEGTDWLAETARACRENGLSPWLSVRMNDSHGGCRPEKSYMNNDLVKHRPELRLDKPCIDPEQRFYRFTMDYAKEECRAYMLSMIDDMLTYDYEGLELDFGRDPVIVKPVASDEDREAVSEFIREIRLRTEKKAAESGKPFYFGMKCSLQTGLLYDYGLDVERLAGEGLFDFLSLSNYYQTCWDAPIEEQKKRFGEETAIFGYVEGAVNWLTVQADEESDRPEAQKLKRGRDMTYSGRMILGNAAGKLILGADSIVFYNSFFSYDRFSKAKPDNWAVERVASLEKLRGEPKAYSLASSFFYPLGTVALEGQASFPEYLWPSAGRTFRLPMIAEPADAGLILKVLIVVERKEAAPRFALSVNTHWPCADFVLTDRLLYPCGDYGTLLPGHIGLVFTFPVSVIKDKWNTFTVYNLYNERADRAENEEHLFRLMDMDIGIMRDHQEEK